MNKEHLLFFSPVLVVAVVGLLVLSQLPDSPTGEAPIRISKGQMLKADAGKKIEPQKPVHKEDKKETNQKKKKYDRCMCYGFISQKEECRTGGDKPTEEEDTYERWKREGYSPPKQKPKISDCSESIPLTSIGACPSQNECEKLCAEHIAKQQFRTCPHPHCYLIGTRNDDPLSFCTSK